MKTEIANKKLQEFLESNGFFSLFIEEVTAQDQQHLLDRSTLSINTALTWADTKQGAKFWRMLSREFEGAKVFEAHKQYSIEKLRTDNGFRIGCNSFTYSDVRNVASMIIEERNFTLISDNRVVVVEYDEDGDVSYRLVYQWATYKRTFTKDTVNYILSKVYHLKKI